MSDGGKEVKYDITANNAGYLAAMQQCAAATSGAAGQIKSQFDTVGKAFEHVQSKLLMIAGIVAGGKFFKEAIAETNKLTSEQMSLAKRLDMAGDEAAALNTALGDIGSDSETYIGAFDKFAKQIKNNEEGLQAMGLKTRDTNGNLRDSNTLFTEALQTVGKYKPGLDQTTAAMTLFGKGVDDVLKLQRLNNDLVDEAREKNEALGLTLSQEGVDAAKAYRAAMNDVDDVFQALKVNIGKAVMPVFTELSNYFASTGPDVVDIFKKSLSGLMLVFRGVQMSVKVMAGAVFEAISTVLDASSLMSEVFAKMVTGDFSGAFKTGQELGARIAGGLKRAFITNGEEAFAEAQKLFQADMQRIWGPGTAVKPPKAGKERMGDFNKTNGTEKKEPSQMGDWEATLAERKLAFMEVRNAEGSFQQFSKQQEVEYWRGILEIAKEGTKDRVAVRRKLAELQLDIGKEAFASEVAILQTQAAAWKNNTDERLALLDKEATLTRQRYGAQSKEFEEVQKRIVEVKRQAAEQLQQIELVQVQRARTAQAAEIGLREEAARLDLQLGLIDQQQMLQLQQQFEVDRQAIALAALREREAMAQRDSDRNPVALAQLQAEIEQLEQQHQLRLAQIRNQSTVETARNITDTLGNIQSSWASLLSKLGQGTMTIGQFVRGIFGSVAAAVEQTVATMAAKWMVQKAAMLIFGKTTAVAEVATEAAKAGAGGTASMAAAPWPLNMTAPAFGASMAAIASTYGALASAAGGYDIPSGVNPVTQLHQREMVLPEKHADVIRALAEGGGQGGAGGQAVHYHDHTGTLLPAQIRANVGIIAAELQRLKRRGYTAG